MNAATTLALMRRLQDGGIDVANVARAGGGVWCFGSRASECASADSDWDVLLVTTEPVIQYRFDAGRLDVVQVSYRELHDWATSELAAHVATYGVRIDDGREIRLRATPVMAAPRKCSVVAARATHVDRLWDSLQPAQREHATLRLRRDLHRAWLLKRAAPVPPTAILDGEWEAFGPRTRAAILRVTPIPPPIGRAIRELDG
jgi:hypothetical protein